ncbi:MAG TPA: THUMP domain-containing protein [Nitrososphaerales archaeon]|nr:THUMP domain-containing protein [Nitrososphaerales archaeon]
MNLVVTSAKGLEAKASAEFKEIALLSGARKVSLERSSYDGIVEVEVEKPKELMTFLSDFVKSEPFRVRYIMRVIPVSKVVDTQLEQISRAVKELSTGIDQGEKFRITIESRDSPYTNKQLIDAVADIVDRDVDLDSPDKIVFIQIFGEYTGVSVVSPDEVISIAKLKRAV